jgi:hypothetical protein
MSAHHWGMTTATSPVALAETPRPESINLVSNREWIASMPLDVRIALAAIEDTGAAVNEFESGSIFYEAEVDFIGMPSSLGAVIGYVCDAISDYCERYYVPTGPEGLGMSEDVSTVLSFIRVDTLRGSYNEGLARLLRWVGEDTSRYEDDDETDWLNR